MKNRVKAILLVLAFVGILILQYLLAISVK